jgi:hypothetical protein
MEEKGKLAPEKKEGKDADASDASGGAVSERLTANLSKRLEDQARENADNHKRLLLKLKEMRQGDVPKASGSGGEEKASVNPVTAGAANMPPPGPPPKTIAKAGNTATSDAPKTPPQGLPPTIAKPGNTATSGAPKTPPPGPPPTKSGDKGTTGPVRPRPPPPTKIVPK